MSKHTIILPDDEFEAFNNLISGTSTDEKADLKRLNLDRKTLIETIRQELQNGRLPSVLKMFEITEDELQKGVEQ